MITSRTLAKTALELSLKPDAEKHIDVFIEYLKTHNLLGLLPQTVFSLRQLLEHTQEHDTLHIYTQYPLSQEEIQSIQRVTGAHGSTSFEQHIDETNVGGFWATYQGRLYNGTLSHQITRLTKHMLIEH